MHRFFRIWVSEGEFVGVEHETGAEMTVEVVADYGAVKSEWAGEVHT